MRFPNQYLVRNEVVGEGAASIREGRVTCLIRIKCGALEGKACIEECINALVERVRSALEDVLAGRLVRHVMTYGGKLANVGEGVEVTLQGGGFVRGEVMGYGAKGELIIATRSGLAKVRPSRVAKVKTLWP